jgi:hypothetical protein
VFFYIVHVHTCYDIYIVHRCSLWRLASRNPL